MMGEDVPSQEPQPQKAQSPEQDCDEVIDHIEGYLKSDQTTEDECELRNAVGVTPAMDDVSVEEVIRVMMKRSCCETAPEALRLRIYTQVLIWRTQG